MPNNNYARGAQFERKVKEYLESKGYYAVRAAGSHGLTDVIAVGPYDDIGRFSVVLFIQCKTGKAKMTPAQRETLYSDSLRYGASPLLATPDGALITFQELRYNGELQEVVI